MSEPEKITREYALANRLVFYPATEDEAAAIQRRIFAMGFAWADERRVVRHLADCVRKGILLDHGELYYSPTKSDRNITCSIRQLDEDYMPKTERRMQEMFNILMARMDDLQEQMNRIEARLSPESLDKPARRLPSPKNGGG